MVKTIILIIKQNLKESILMFLLLFIIVLAIKSCRSNPGLLGEKEFIITDIFIKSNQFVINNKYLLKLVETRFDGSDINLQIQDIIEEDNVFGDEFVRIFFKDIGFGYVKCEIIARLDKK